MELLKLKGMLEKLAYYTKQNLNLYLNKERESLNYWIKKLINKGLLIPIKKGFYISSFYLDKVKERNETEEYLEYLAGIIRYPSYVSLEYALAKYGLIPESAYVITSITRKTTRTYQSKITTFLYRNIKESLFTGFIEEKYNKQIIKIATPAKALFDYLYFKKFSSFDEIKDYLLETGRINWFVLNENDKKMIKKYFQLPLPKKMSEILKILISNKIL